MTAQRRTAGKTGPTTERRSPGQPLPSPPPVQSAPLRGSEGDPWIGWMISLEVCESLNPHSGAVTTRHILRIPLSCREPPDGVSGHCSVERPAEHQDIGGVTEEGQRGVWEGGVRRRGDEGWGSGCGEGGRT